MMEEVALTLSEYGYSLTPDGFIRGDKGKTDLHVTTKGKRVHVRQGDGGPIVWSGHDIGRFVEGFWYAKRIERIDPKADAVRAKLPISAGPGFRLVVVERFGTFGDVEIWKKAVHDDPLNAPMGYVIVNGVLFGIGNLDFIRRYFETTPITMEQLLERLRTGQRDTKTYAWAHPVMWEALGMDMDEREALLEEQRRAREEEETRRSQQEMEKLRAIMSRISTGEPVSGDDLLYAIDSLGLKITKNTRGNLRLFKEISATRGIGPKIRSNAPFDAYRNVQETLRRVQS